VAGPSRCAVPVIGWSDTHVPRPTVDAYAAQLVDLAEALVIHRDAEGRPTSRTNEDNGEQDAGAEPAKPSSVCRCGCPRRIVVAPSILALGPITCGNCGEDFDPSS